MDPETRDNFDRIYRILTKIEVNGETRSQELISFRSKAKLGHVFLFLILFVYAILIGGIICQTVF